MKDNHLLNQALKKRWHRVTSILRDLKKLTRHEAEAQINAICTQNNIYQGVTTIWLAAAAKKWHIVEKIINFKLDNKKPNILSLFKTKHKKQLTVHNSQHISIDLDAVPLSIDNPNYGTTVVLLTAIAEKWPLAEQIMRKGADLKIAIPRGINQGKNIFWYLIDGKRWSLAQEVIDASEKLKINLDAQATATGITPLWIASALNEKVLIRELINKKADINTTATKDNEKLSILDLALKNQNDDLVYELISRGAYCASENNKKILKPLKGLDVDIIRKILNGEFDNLKEEYDNMVCPITLSLPIDPVYIAGEKTCYEKMALKEWLNKPENTEKTTPKRTKIDFSVIEKQIIPNEIQDNIANYIKNIIYIYRLKSRLRNRSTSS